MFLNSGSEAIDGALKLARRVTGRPGIIAFRGGFHGRTFGATSVTTSNINYRTGYEPLLPGVYFAPYPAAYPRVRRRRGGGLAGEPRRSCARCWPRSCAPSTVGSILIEPVLGEGGYIPAPAAFLRALRDAVRRARHPAHRRRGPVGLRPDGPDVGLRARRDRPRRRVRGQGDRQRAAALGDRVVSASSRSAGVAARTARRTAGTRSPARPGSRCSRRSATRTSSRTPWRAAPSSRRASARSPPRTTGSATSAGPG